MLTSHIALRFRDTFIAVRFAKVFLAGKAALPSETYHHHDNTERTQIHLLILRRQSGSAENVSA